MMFAVGILVGALVLGGDLVIGSYIEDYLWYFLAAWSYNVVVLTFFGLMVGAF